MCEKMLCINTGHRSLKCTCEVAICIVQFTIQLNSKTCLLHKNIRGFFYQKQFCFWLLNDKRGGITSVICSKWWSDWSECMLNITGVSNIG